MEIINLKSTEDTPHVILDALSGQFEITEKSLPEDAAQFYNVILDWLSRYIKEPNPQTNFVFKLDYFNTASAKQLFKILSLLEILSKTNEVIISWYYMREDKDMLASGERYAKLVNIKINLIEYC